MKGVWGTCVVVTALCLWTFGCGSSDGSKDGGTQTDSGTHALDDAGLPDAGVPDAGDQGGGTMVGRLSFPLRSVAVTYADALDGGGFRHDAVAVYGSPDLDHTQLCDLLQASIFQSFSTLFSLAVATTDGGDLAEATTYDLVQVGIPPAISIAEHAPGSPPPLLWAYFGVDGGITLDKVTAPQQLVGSLYSGGAVDLTYSANLGDAYQGTVPLSGHLHAAGCDRFYLTGAPPL